MYDVVRLGIWPQGVGLMADTGGMRGPTRARRGRYRPHLYFGLLCFDLVGTFQAGANLIVGSGVPEDHPETRRRSYPKLRVRSSRGESCAIRTRIDWFFLRYAIKCAARAYRPASVPGIYHHPLPSRRVNSAKALAALRADGLRTPALGLD